MAGRRGSFGVRPAVAVALAIGLVPAGCGPTAEEGAHLDPGPDGGSIESHQVSGFGQDGPVISTGGGPMYLPPDVRAASAAVPVRFGFGRAATEGDIVPLDIDVGPDGEGLPDGAGSPEAGAAIFTAKCAHCHGLEGEGGLNDRLVALPQGEGGRAIGNYWPYATTLFDYVRRAMPYDQPGSLTDDEVWDVTAWLLFRNGLIESGDTVDRSTLPDIVMPGLARFLADDREAFRQVR